MNIYTTLMGLAAGGGLVILAVFAEYIKTTSINNEPVNLQKWVYPFLVVGAISAILGTTMTVSWPLEDVPDSFVPNCCEADNIIFGQSSMFFGFLLIALSFLLDKAGNNVLFRGLAEIEEMFLPLALVGLIAGLSLLPMAIGGLSFGLFLAPVNEPISGTLLKLFPNIPIERYYVVIAYTLAGIGGILSPVVLKNRAVYPFFRWPLLISGVMFIILSLVDIYGQIGLVT